MRSSFKKLAVGSLFFIFGLLIAPTHPAGSENPWDLLKDFRHVQGTLRAVENHYVAALFYHPEKKLRALVIFSTSCRGRRCSLGQPIAYSVFDGKGLIVTSHEDSSDLLLERVLTSSAMFTTA